MGGGGGGGGGGGDSDVWLEYKTELASKMLSIVSYDVIITSQLFSSHDSPSNTMVTDIQ